MGTQNIFFHSIGVFDNNDITWAGKILYYNKIFIILITNSPHLFRRKFDIWLQTM